MLKKIIIAINATLLFSISTFTNATTIAQANTEHTIPQQCSQLFTETEQLIEEAEKQPGTHTQFAHIKNKLSESKKQILALERNVQIESCDRGLIALNHLKNQPIQP